MKKKLFSRSIFSEQITRSTNRYFHRSGEATLNWEEAFLGSNVSGLAEAAISNWRRTLIMGVLLLIGFGLFLRLFHLQINQGDQNRLLADSNRIQVKVIHAPRGVIYDRNGKILAQNEPGFRLVSESTGSGRVKTRYISRDEQLKMEVNNDPALHNLEMDNLRSYPLGEAAAHIIGYVGEVNESELDKNNSTSSLISKLLNVGNNAAGSFGYRNGDRIGRSGVEDVYEKVLRGIDGGEVIEVDAAGQYVRTLGRTEPIPGQNLVLSIDSDLQAVVFEQLNKGVEAAEACCGAAIVTDPNNGEILAMASYPSFKPDQVENYFNDSTYPLLNRVIAGLYPPGSTFKIATALAGLNSGKIKADTRFEDTGIMHLGPYSFANWYFTQYGLKDEGGVDVVRALQRSNDIYFYQLGHTVGVDQMGQTAKELGFGKKTGIDLPGEAVGIIPNNDWKMANFNQPWYPGDSLHMAIGQGFVTVTPIQVADLISFIAADGKSYPPHLGYQITDSSGKVIKEYKFDSFTVSYKPEYIELIKQGLEAVPREGGTAWPFLNFPIVTAGKTGTAEFGDPDDKTHAWYTSYAPVDQPQITVTTLLEAGGEGSSDAAPIAKEIYRWYFSPDKADLIKDVNAVATSSANILRE